MQETPLEFAVKQGNQEAVDLLIEDTFGKKFLARRSEAHSDNVLIQKLGTGSYVGFDDPFFWLSLFLSFIPFQSSNGLAGEDEELANLVIAC